MDLDMLAKRFDRIEEKLDGMQAAFISLARTEEKVAHVIDQNVSLSKKNDKLTERVTNLEKDNVSQSKSIGFFERMSWLIAGTIATIAAWFMR